MAEMMEEVQHLVTMAQAQQNAGNFAAAAISLEQGIDILKGALTASSDSNVEESAIAVYLADLYGMLGGALRKQGNYLAAAAAYDHGFGLEADSRYAMLSTYNALNRLTTRILLCPGCLVDPELLRMEDELEYIDVKRELAELKAQLYLQVAGPRARDFWAAGDLSLICALNEDELGVNHGLEKFSQLAPPSAAYDAYHHSIEELALLDTPEKAILLKAKAAWSRR